MSKLNKHYLIVLQAFFVTLLWSSSFVIIKFGLKSISPLTFAAMRYLIASVLLIIVLSTNKNEIEKVKKISKRWFLHISLYGIIFVAITQGTGFLSLNLLSAITVSFVLNFTVVIVLFLSIIFLNEKPNNKQLIMILISLIGVILYFFPIEVKGNLGLLFLVISLIANSISSVYGRKINKQKIYSPLIITTISMTIGSIVLLIFALIIEGIPLFSFIDIVYIIWLACVNTALAFIIWNKALRYLTAVESTVINSTMLPQITILAIMFLDEFPTIKEWIGISIMFISAIFVQLFKNQSILS